MSKEIIDPIVKKKIASNKFGNTKVSSMIKTYKINETNQYEYVAKIVFKGTDKEHEIRVHKASTSKEGVFSEQWDIPKDFPYKSFIKDLNNHNIFIRKEKETSDTFFILLSMKTLVEE